MDARFVTELGQLRILWNRLAEANPRLRTDRPDVQHRLELRGVVQRRKANGHESGIGIAAREQWRTALRAEAASSDTATARVNRVRFRRTSDLYVRVRDNEARSKWGAAGTLTIQTVAIEHREGRAWAHVTNRPTCAPAGKWSGHIETSAARPKFHSSLSVPGPANKLASTRVARPWSGHRSSPASHLLSPNEVNPTQCI